MTMIFKIFDFHGMDSKILHCHSVVCKVLGVVFFFFFTLLNLTCYDLLCGRCKSS